MRVWREREGEGEGEKYCIYLTIKFSLSSVTLMEGTPNSRRARLKSLITTISTVVLSVKVGLSPLLSKALTCGKGVKL